MAHIHWCKLGVFEADSQQAVSAATGIYCSEPDSWGREDVPKSLATNALVIIVSLRETLICEVYTVPYWVGLKLVKQRKDRSKIGSPHFGGLTTFRHNPYRPVDYALMEIFWDY